MLSILGRRHSFCGGLSRRSFLQIGGLAMGGMGLPGILQAQSHGAVSEHKGIIMVYLAGGPPHQDMWDVKTDAPSEIRGEFRPIRTRVPGIEVSEVFPRVAAVMDKVAIIRTVVGCRDEHSPQICYNGYSEQESREKRRPCLGAFLSSLQGPVHRAMPPFVSLALKTTHKPWANPGDTGFLGPAHSAFTPDGDGMADMTLRGVTLDRLGDRRSLLAGLDRFRRGVDARGGLDGLDAFTQQALGVLTSNRLAEALDLSREHLSIREMYGRGRPFHKSGEHPANWHTEQFLMARRLIQAGVRCVTLNFGTWDTHLKNFDRMRAKAPDVDLGVAALVEDLHQQGMQNDVSVVVWGEFGRTPRINKEAGRDHWPAVSCALLAGGGIRAGQAIGKTNRLGESPVERPVHVQEVFATLYANLGIDVANTTVTDHQGRPQYLLERPTPISELA